MRLRAHHFLCLLGFRGLGYSSEFVANLAAIAARLREDPTLEVEALASADHVCQACPHLDAAAADCAKGSGPREKDQNVLAALGVSAGTRLSWAEWQRRVAQRIDLETHAVLCGNCRWASLGYCQEGLAALRARHAPTTGERGG